MRCVTLPLLCLLALTIVLAGCVTQPPTATMRPVSTRPLEQQLKAQDQHITNLEAQVQQLAASVDATNNELSTLRAEISQINSRNQHTNTLPIRSTTELNTGANTQAQQQSAPAQPSATELYLSGFSAYTSGIYPAAAENFSSFISNYPRNPYIANAYYWLGETYLAQGKMQIARDVFSTLVKNYPSASKAADAQLKLAQIYAQLNQTPQAQAALTTLRQQYPDSTANKNIPTKLLELLSR
ncbi:MAG: tol-pal system protein YbgF [Desulfuromonas sp.]|nr:tol-pal system protein YbgF [Desulfuromonas sp.]